MRTETVRSTVGYRIYSLGDGQRYSAHVHEPLQGEAEWKWMANDTEGSEDSIPGSAPTKNEALSAAMEALQNLEKP